MDETKLWEFCTAQTEVSIHKVATKLEIPYSTLYNWWRGKRHGQEKRPTMPHQHLKKVLQWATERGYQPPPTYIL